eukprot:CAMPEP_0195527352 /NCGR_PEP_ID=MMETSP0794_2-20130614/28975_1 /TAXON_ID=515487 /ORGANISM="Stephanopyxis turris, Strain CCMP 815" /LENGTH=356 /DNA_ID=CAMNT_0040658245 /DNA_START=159 /DNA_END=1229 /DNA_ORIENTATION=-
MHSENSLLSEDFVPEQVETIDISYTNPERKATKGKILIAALTVPALCAVFYSQTSTSSSVFDAQSVANLDEIYFSWEAAIFEYGNNLTSFDKLDLYSEKHEGTLKELLYLNNTYAFDQLKTDGKDSSSLDFYYYQQGWEAQINQAYCAIATSAAVLNSLRGKITLPQDEVYSPYPWATQNQVIRNECVRENVYDIDKVKHLFMGLVLEQTEKLLDCHLADQGYTVKAYHVDPQKITKEEVRDAIKGAVIDPEVRVVINFDRGGISQGDMGHGHFSPIGSYNHEMDAFLVMDVAKYKYPAVWVPTAKLMRGIGSLDNCANFRYNGTLPDPSVPKADSLKEFSCKAEYRGYIIIKPTV